MAIKIRSQSTLQDDTRIQEFLDMIAPSVVKFNTDHFICGNTYRCVWALREYPTETTEQAILRHLGEKDGITLHIYTRHVSPVEEKKIISSIFIIYSRHVETIIMIMNSGSKVK